MFTLLLAEQGAPGARPSSFWLEFVMPCLVGDAHLQFGQVPALRTSVSERVQRRELAMNS